MKEYIHQLAQMVDATPAALVAGGKKPLGLIDLTLSPQHDERIVQLLGEAGLETYVASRRYEAPEQDAAWVAHVEQLAALQGREPRREGGRVMLDDIPSEVYFTKEGQVSLEDAARAYTEDPARFGRLAGYPDCCVDAFQGSKSVQHFRSQVRERIQRQGIDAITHLPGVGHMPHDIDCEATKELGYADYLKKEFPTLWASNLHFLSETLYD